MRHGKPEVEPERSDNIRKNDSSFTHIHSVQCFAALIWNHFALKQKIYCEINYFDKMMSSIKLLNINLSL